MSKRNFILEGITDSSDAGKRVRMSIVIVRAGSFDRAAEKLGGRAALPEGTACTAFQPIPGSLGKLAAIMAKSAEISNLRNGAYVDSTSALKLLKQFTTFQLTLLPVIE